MRKKIIIGFVIIIFIAAVAYICIKFPGMLSSLGDDFAKAILHGG
ncbi:MAG: hypothetical protein PHW01_00840 [Patescibacteria group bacterium]|nr:hypothetical protein [Patescibacteria group bacterium]